VVAAILLHFSPKDKAAARTTFATKHSRNFQRHKP
jgi:hypothetical protein